jgi:predicted DNA-binding transcriptional regulator YafY
MSLSKEFKRLQYFDSLLCKREACTVEKLQKKLNMSRSSILMFIKDMRVTGIPIEYSKKNKCYRYTIVGRIVKELFQPE